MGENKKVFLKSFAVKIIFTIACLHLSYQNYVIFGVFEVPGYIVFYFWKGALTFLTVVIFNLLWLIKFRIVMHQKNFKVSNNIFCV